MTNATLRSATRSWAILAGGVTLLAICWMLPTYKTTYPNILMMILGGFAVAVVAILGHHCRCFSCGSWATHETHKPTDRSLGTMERRLRFCDSCGSRWVRFMDGERLGAWRSESTP